MFCKYHQQISLTIRFHSVLALKTLDSLSIYFYIIFISFKNAFFPCLFPLRYLNKDRDATMSILDIGLLTGFTVNTNDLDIVRSSTHTHTHTDLDL